MFQVFEKTNFNDISFVSKLAEDGFDIHNVGGKENPHFSKNEVICFDSGQYQLLGDDSTILTCHPNVFFKTLIDIENQFDYRLFG